MIEFSYTYDNILEVAENIRAEDAREIYATRWSESPQALADHCLHAGDFAWVFGDETGPIAVVGAVPTWPNVWSVFMFATDRFGKIGLGLTRHVKRVMIPAMVDVGVHRASCYSIEGHEEAHRWLKVLGAEVEHTCKFFGKDGETFYCFSWTLDKVSDYVHFPESPKR